MTPHSADADVVRNKLDALAYTLSTLQSIGPVDADKLRSDPVTAAAIERLLCRLVDIAVAVNSPVPSALRAYADYQRQIAEFIVSGTAEDN